MWKYMVYAIVLVGLSIFLWIRKSKRKRTWIDNVFGGIQKILIGIPVILITLDLATLLGAEGDDKADSTSGLLIIGNFGGIPIGLSKLGDVLGFILVFIPLFGAGMLAIFGIIEIWLAVVNRTKGNKYYRDILHEK